MLCFRICFWLVACCVCVCLCECVCECVIFCLLWLCCHLVFLCLAWRLSDINLVIVSCLFLPPPASPSGKKFRSKPQLARYLGNQMDLSSFDFRTGKMLMSKLNKNRQRLRYDNNNQNKVRRTSSRGRPETTRLEPGPVYGLVGSDASGCMCCLIYAAVI